MNNKVVYLHVITKQYNFTEMKKEWTQNFPFSMFAAT